MSISKRLTRLFESRNTTYYKVALSVGLDPALLANMLSGKRKASFEKWLSVLAQIANSPLIDLPHAQLAAMLALDYLPPGTAEHLKALEAETRETKTMKALEEKALTSLKQEALKALEKDAQEALNEKAKKSLEKPSDRLPSSQKPTNANKE